MAESTINIKHNVQPHSAIGKKEAILNDLVKFVNFRRLNLADGELDELIRLLADDEIVSIIGSDTKDMIMNSIYCGKCRKRRMIQLSCRCKICEHEAQDIIQEVTSLIENAEYMNSKKNIDIQYILTKVHCPACNMYLTKQDFKNCGEDIEAVCEVNRIEKIKTMASQSEEFFCEVCERMRGHFLLPDETAHPCLHMCLFCIFKNYSINKSKQCVKCEKKINMSSLYPIKSKCFQCSKEFFFGGDRMVEIDPNFILCVNCSYVQLYDRYSIISKRNLDLKENFQYYFYLFRVCGKCRREVFIEEMNQKSCCFEYFCENCLSDRKSECPKCGS